MRPHCARRSTRPVRRNVPRNADDGAEEDAAILQSGDPLLLGGCRSCKCFKTTRNSLYRCMSRESFSQLIFDSLHSNILCCPFLRQAHFNGHGRPATYMSHVDKKKKKIGSATAAGYHLEFVMCCKEDGGTCTKVAYDVVADPATPSGFRSMRIRK